ncbi:TPA: hypothetical protein ACN1ND_000286 [Enterococcus faecalis]|nr:hypothetical protein [Enterococcus faecalis]EKQ3613480.1 hypothetical protein [Enterococcus faecalis]
MNSEKVFANYFFQYDIFFDKKCKESNLIKDKYHEIKSKMWTSIENVKKDNFFQIFREILNLDAQLQIMVSLVESDIFIEGEEQCILSMVSSDYLYYYKETFNYAINDEKRSNNLLCILQD